MNEEENIELLYKSITDVFQEITSDYEIIVVDDGSTDRTY